jgi:2-dehydro-3-deoxygluconokinase
MSTNVIAIDQIKPASICQYDNASLGEVMLRLDPFDVPTSAAKQFRVWQGGGETNVACGLAYTFGLRSMVLTALVDDHIGLNIRNQLRYAGVDPSHIVWFNTKNDGSRFSTDQKGSLMNGINFTYVGKGVLPSDTLYYRAHSAARQLQPGDFDWEMIFGDQGVRVFNTGGIFTLLSLSSAELALEAVENANIYGTLVAADLNYRSKVEPDKERARQINRRITPYLGFLVGNDSDLADALGYETPKTTGDFDAWLDAYMVTVRKLAADYPNLSLIGTQWRGATSADTIDWGGVLFDTRADKFYSALLRKNVPIQDRTGGGDSFLSGVLAALLKGKDLQTAVEWGAAHGVLVQEIPGDITLVTEKEVLAEIKRARAGSGVKATR